MKSFKPWQTTITAVTMVIGFLSIPSNTDASSNECSATTSGKCMTKPAPLPKSLDDFLTLREQIGTTPWGGFSLWLYGLMVQAEKNKRGMKMLLIATAASQLVDGKRYKGREFNRADLEKISIFNRNRYCANAYAVGATPTNGYSFDPTAVSFELRYSPKDIKESSARLFVCSEGTSSCRPVSMSKNSKGIWKVEKFSSVTMSCMKPTVPRPDDEL